MFKPYPLLLAALLTPGISLADLRDPTLPGNLAPRPNMTAQSTGDKLLTLTAIWISDTSKRATINGVTVSRGETLPDGSKILQIKPGYVLVRQNGLNKKLYLVQSVKKPVK